MPNEPVTINSTSWKGGMIMSYPNNRNPRINEDLLPSSIFNSIEYWIHSIFEIDDAMLSEFQTQIISFRTEFLRYVHKADEVQLPDMMKASKKRAASLAEFCQKVILLLDKGYSCDFVTKDYDLLKSNFNVRFAKYIIGYNPNDKNDFIDLEIDITSNPKMYRRLYYLVLRFCRSDVPNELKQLIALISQSMGYIYEAVNLTADEIIQAEEEFLQAATSEDCWDEDSELSKLMEMVAMDMKSKTPPKYISDFKQVRRSHDGYIYNHPWTIEDAWYSTSSSGSSLVIDNKRIPNIGLLLSAFETDYSDPIDELIGYKSLYPKESFNGLTQRESTTITVPKTSSRGLRVIHMNSNGRQDRGSYFENMCKHTLKNIVKCDTTFPDTGKDGTEFIRSVNRNDNRVLICTDMKSATDYVSHQFLEKFWNIIFPEGCSSSLMNLHSGDGIFIRHFKEGMQLKRHEDPYKQISGIKCGTRSNFAVGLTYPHNFILRCTMKSLGLEDEDPSSLYVVHGDDNALYLPELYWEEFLNKYMQLCKEAGFFVHPLSEKGMISFPHDLFYRAEYNKQVWSDGILVSRIPHKLFFAKATVDKKLQLLLWLSQYEYLHLNGDTIKKTIINRYFDESIIPCWNFLVEKKLFNLPYQFRIDYDYVATDQDKYNLSLQIFINTISNSIYDTVLNNRSRLSEQQVRQKIQDYTRIFNDENVINTAISWINEQAPDKIGKLEFTIQKNQSLADEMMIMYKDPIIWASSLFGFFSNDEKELISTCISHARFSRELDLSMIDTFLGIGRVLARTQPHNISKRSHTSTSIIVKTLNNMFRGLGEPTW